MVFWVENNGQNAPELLKEEIGDANIQIAQKPVNATELKAIFMESSVTQHTRSNTKTSATVVETTEQA